MTRGSGEEAPLRFEADREGPREGERARRLLDVAADRIAQRAPAPAALRPGGCDAAAARVRLASSPVPLLSGHPAALFNRIAAPDASESCGHCRMQAPCGPPRLRYQRAHAEA